MTAAESIPTRRQILAFVALQDLPTPHVVQLIDSEASPDPAPALRLRFHGPDAETRLRAWGALLGLAGLVGRRKSLSGDTPTRESWQMGTWRGLPVMLTATAPLPPGADAVDELDQATVDELGEIAGPDEGGES